MSRRALTILAFGVAVALTLVGFLQVWLYKWVPPQKVAIWFPVLLLIRLPDEFLRLFVSLFQFPALAAVFVIGNRRWRAIPMFCVVVVVYALCVTAALVRTR